jgi:predicted dehydrogenase
MGLRHVQVARSLGLELVGLSDCQPAALERAVLEAGVPPACHFTDARIMLERTQPAVVIVATTAPTHCEFTCLAAEAGAQAILCEKPMAISLAECDQMVATCQRHGTRLAINHQMRFMEQYTEARRCVQEPGFGGLASVTVLAGNFGLAMNGSHYLEMFRYMTGEVPVEISAWFSSERVSNPRGPQFEDRAGCLRAVTALGTRFYLDASSDHGHGFQAFYAGRCGQLTVDEAAGAFRLTQRDAEHRTQPTTRYLMPHTITERRIQPADAVAPTRAVLAALLAGTNYPTGEEGRLVVNALVAAHFSDEQGHRAVSLADAEIDRARRFPWA